MHLSGTVQAYVCCLSLLKVPLSLSKVSHLDDKLYGHSSYMKHFGLMVLLDPNKEVVSQTQFNPLFFTMFEFTHWVMSMYEGMAICVYLLAMFLLEITAGLS